MRHETVAEAATDRSSQDTVVAPSGPPIGPYREYFEHFPVFT